MNTAIKNLGGRDFDKKKLIIAGVYLKDNPDRLVGLAEMFDYKKRENKITVGYRLNDGYWNQKIATNTLNLMMEYLVNEIGITKSRTNKVINVLAAVFTILALLLVTLLLVSHRWVRIK